MAHTYGFLKGKVADIPGLRHKRIKHEIQYHLHATIQFDLSSGTTQDWDTAIDVGTNDSDDGKDSVNTSPLLVFPREGG